MHANPDAEKAVWAAVVDNNRLLDELAVTPGEFAVPMWRSVYAAALELRANGKLVDPIAVADKLSSHVTPADLTKPLVDGTAVGEQNAHSSAAIIREHALTRRVLDALTDAVDDGRHRGYRGTELLDKALQRLTALDRGTDTDALAMVTVVRQRLGEIEERLAHPERYQGIATGLRTLDDQLNGLPRGLATVVCGRPSHGKSAFCMQVAAHASQQVGVHVFSLEDPRAMYADRYLAWATRAAAENIRTGTITRQQMAGVATAIAHVAHAKWLYHDCSRISAADLVRKVRQHRKENNTELVVVDYLTLLKSPEIGLTKHEAVSANMHVLADAAKNDKMAYLVVCQLNREGERRPDKRPRVSDLRLSGEIEERSKLILGCYRGSLYGEPQEGVDYEREWERPDPETWERRFSLLILKDSNGALGQAHFEFDGPTMRITDRCQA